MQPETFPVTRAASTDKLQNTLYLLKVLHEELGKLSEIVFFFEWLHIFCLCGLQLVVYINNVRVTLMESIFQSTALGTQRSRWEV